MSHNQMLLPLPLRRLDQCLLLEPSRSWFLPGVLLSQHLMYLLSLKITHTHVILPITLTKVTTQQGAFLLLVVPTLVRSQLTSPSQVAAQPISYPQPMAAPFQYPPYQPYPQYMIQPQPSTTGLPTFHISQPAYNTIGLTGSDVLQQQLATAQGLEMNTKQEMKPSDDDPMRMYWVRELDGTYTQRNRLTIDSGDIGDCRWYAQDGVFYAVRLPS